ncbi:hypothetical protein AB5J72_02645 [Streptomyces sp. CG1]|uniref:hypothetical protein n=1 Tax=Streptomyces sp. CG1 TaxID=1287523 RepID=UPI0034E1EBE6
MISTDPSEQNFSYQPIIRYATDGTPPVTALSDRLLCMTSAYGPSDWAAAHPNIIALSEPGKPTPPCRVPGAS